MRLKIHKNNFPDSLWNKIKKIHTMNMMETLEKLKTLENEVLVFESKHAVVICVSIGNFKYEGITGALDSAPGGYALNLTRKVMKYLFTETDCLTIVSSTPVENKKANAMNKYLKPYTLKTKFNEILKKKSLLN